MGLSSRGPGRHESRDKYSYGDDSPDSTKQIEEIIRDNIWFTEKDDCGATELFPLSDFKPRKEENRERRYLAGRYGAVPIMNDELFAAALIAHFKDGVVDACSRARHLDPTGNPSTTVWKLVEALRAAREGS